MCRRDIWIGLQAGGHLDRITYRKNIWTGLQAGGQLDSITLHFLDGQSKCKGKSNWRGQLAMVFGKPELSCMVDCFVDFQIGQGKNSRKSYKRTIKKWKTVVQFLPDPKPMPRPIKLEGSINHCFWKTWIILHGGLLCWFSNWPGQKFKKTCKKKTIKKWKAVVQFLPGPKPMPRPIKLEGAISHGFWKTWIILHGGLLCWFSNWPGQKFKKIL